MRVYVGSGSDQGRVKRSNQDAVGVDLASGLFLIADGVGGHIGGDVASGIVLLLAKEWVVAAKPAYQDRKAALLGAIREANSRIFQIAVSENKRGMSSTVTAFLIGSGRYFVAQVGDSRAYLIRGNEIGQVTKDHSQVQQLVDSGIITSEEARRHENRNVITRAVGLDSDVEIDTFEGEFRETDAILACSDGLWEEVTDKEILATVLSSVDGQQACNSLIEQANARGGHDNISVILAQSTPTMRGAVPRGSVPILGRSAPRVLTRKKVLIGAAAVALVAGVVPLVLRFLTPYPPPSMWATFATTPNTLYVSSTVGGARVDRQLRSGDSLLLRPGDKLRFKREGFTETTLVVEGLARRYYRVELASRVGAAVVGSDSGSPAREVDTVRKQPARPQPSSAKVTVIFMPGGAGRDIRGAEVFLDDSSRGCVPFRATLERNRQYKAVVKFNDGTSSKPRELTEISRDPSQSVFRYWGKDFSF